MLVKVALLSLLLVHFIFYCMSNFFFKPALDFYFFQRQERIRIKTILKHLEFTGCRHHCFEIIQCAGVSKQKAKNSDA